MADLLNSSLLRKIISRALMLIVATTFFFSSRAQTFTVLDDFNSGTVVGDSVLSMAKWKIFKGSFAVATRFNSQTFFGERSKSLIATDSINRLSTPFTKVCNAWELEIDPEITTSGQFDAYFFFMTNASPDPISSSGYYVGYDHKEYKVNLYRMDNGVTADTIISYLKGSFGSRNPFKIRITVQNDTWSLYVNEISNTGGVSTTLRGTGIDATYPLNTCAYQGVWIKLSSSLENNDALDNIKYSEASVCPPGAQEICNNGVDDDCDGVTDNVFRFTGDGNFYTNSNWECGVAPTTGAENIKIIITPQPGGRCNMDNTYEVHRTSSFTVVEGKELLLPTNLILQ